MLLEQINLTLLVIKDSLDLAVPGVFFAQLADARLKRAVIIEPPCLFR